jgi:hypothetical protein
MNPKSDPIIETIREARHEISKEQDHDPLKVVEYYVELQKKYERRLLEESAQELSGEPIKT